MKKIFHNITPVEITFTMQLHTNRMKRNIFTSCYNKLNTKQKMRTT